MKNIVIFMGGVALGAYVMHNHVYHKIVKIYIDHEKELKEASKNE